MTDPQPQQPAADVKADPNEQVVMVHEGIEGEATVTRRQFDKVYAQKGWGLKKDTQPDPADTVTTENAKASSAAQGKAPAATAGNADAK